MKKAIRIHAITAIDENGFELVQSINEKPMFRVEHSDCSNEERTRKQKQIERMKRGADRIRKSDGDKSVKFVTFERVAESQIDEYKRSHDECLCGECPTDKADDEKSKKQQAIFEILDLIEASVNKIKETTGYEFSKEGMELLRKLQERRGKR